ncbi:MAG: FAD-dependent oxidoreductase [Pirellulaceae bacterium]
MLKATTSDFLVVGGGIVGLATAWHLTQCFPDARICLLEKEPQVAQHQSGRNSGVLHSGIYYKPGSLKATTCRSGSMAMQEFCQSEQIRYEICGKIIVAVSPDEVARLDAIHARGLENGIHCRMIDAQEMRHIEPHVAGVKAVYVPEAGIVDYPGVCQRLAQANSSWTPGALQSAGGRHRAAIPASGRAHATRYVSYRFSSYLRRFV